MDMYQITWQENVPIDDLHLIKKQKIYSIYSVFKLIYSLNLHK